MKTNIIKALLGLILTLSISGLYAQSPRIKLNQITKDTVKGSVLISSPSDSGMVYSRDFYIAYGADTVLILYGDTLAATSGIISSVLSDGVTITGDGTTGNELKVDTATVVSTIQGLVDTLTARNYLTANQTITLSGDVTGSGTTAITATVVDDSHNHIISNVDFLQDSLNNKTNTDFSNVSGTLPVANGGTGATTLTSGAFLKGNGTSAVSGSSNLTETADTVFVAKYLDVDTSTLYVDADLNRVGIGTTNLTNELNISSSTNAVLRLNSSITNGNVYITNSASANGDRATLLVNAYYNGINWIKTFNDDPIWASQMRTHEDDFVVLRSDTGSVVSFSTLFQIKKDGGIFAPSLGAAAGTYPVEFNTSTKELTYDNTSSIRFKDNIRPFTKGLNELLQLNPVSYEYKESGFTAHGFIAEQVLDSNLEEIVTYNNEGLVQGLRRKFFFPLIVQSIQEQQAIIESQATEIEQLKTQIQLILNEIEQIKNK